MTVPEAATMSPEQIAKRSGSSFLLSFAFLEKRRRRGLRTVYAYCRAVDDAADDAADADEGERQVQFWRDELERVARGEPETATGRALCETIEEFGVKLEHLRAILDGVAMDLRPRRYADQAELDEYCYHVASAVGLSCLPVFGASGPRAEQYADHLGKALQITNILRDLRSDAEEGRIYAPLDSLARAGVEEEWLRGSGPPEVYADRGPVHLLIGELVGVAEQRFAAAREVMPREQRRALLPAEVMGAVYHELLRSVIARRGRLDRPGRLRVPRWRKLAVAMRTWWRGAR